VEVAAALAARRAARVIEGVRRARIRFQEHTLPPESHFPILTAVSFVAFVAVLRFSINRRTVQVPHSTILWLASVVVVGGMTFAKIGVAAGFPIWLYYGVPATLTWILPPLALRMSRNEIARYVPLVVLVAPVIHVLFSFVLGWKEYMPFLGVPSFRELID
jgi:hypothetical protein